MHQIKLKKQKMNKKNIYGFIALLLFISHTSFSQIGTDPVELDEVVLSLPFDQDLGKSVIKVEKINLNNINPIPVSYTHLRAHETV